MRHVIGGWPALLISRAVQCQPGNQITQNPLIHHIPDMLDQILIWMVDMWWCSTKVYNVLHLNVRCRADTAYVSAVEFRKLFLDVTHPIIVCCTRVST